MIRQLARLGLRVILVAALSPATVAKAATKNWNDGTGLWTGIAGTGSNWTPAGVPGNGDKVNLIFTDGIARTVTYDYTGSAVTLNFLTIDLTNGGTNFSALSMSANNLTSNSEYVGTSGQGLFGQEGGTNTIAAGGGSLDVGVLAGATGYYILAGGSLVANTHEYVGDMGTGDFIQGGGTNTIQGAGHHLYLGYGAGGTGGTYRLDAGSLTVNDGDEFVGYATVGTFNQFFGTNSIGGNLILANNAGSTGTYMLSGGSLSSNNQAVGQSGTGTFNQSGGFNNITSILYLGVNSGSSGTYALSGGILTSLTSQYQYIGYSGTGTFNQSGGTNEIAAGAGFLDVGVFPGATGTYNLSGAGALAVNNHEYVGDIGTGFFNQSGGTNLIQGTGHNLYLGYNAGGTSGTYTLSAGSLYVASGDEFVGYATVGTFNQTGGTNTIGSDGNLFLGTNANSMGTYTLSGGTANVGGSVYVGGSSDAPGGTGNLTVSGLGGLSVAGSLVVYNTPGSGVNLSGGTINAGSIVNQGAFTINSGSLTVGDVTLNSTSLLGIGLGGISRGSQYGALTASGSVSLAGTIQVLLDSFTPTAGQSFDILDWGTLTGEFADIDLPTLATGLMWNASQLYTEGVLRVQIVGDYNADGTVNAADYTIWRNSRGQAGQALAADGNADGSVTQLDYNVWKTHYGETAPGNGSISAASASVPEPTTLALLILGMTGLLSRHRMKHSLNLSCFAFPSATR